MGFTLDINISAVSVFLQGLISFFSPCVLPLIPLYVGYLSGGTMSKDENGNMTYKRSKVLGNTCCFVIGISFAFILMGLGVSALSSFLNQYQTWITVIGGILILLLGLYQFGIFGSSKLLGNTHRLSFRAEKLAMSPITALLMGFTFSFAWTPCVGPALTSVLLMAASSEKQFIGFLLILLYTLGFVLPFLFVGLFTTSVLNFFRNHMQIVKYTTKIGALIMIFVGASMLWDSFQMRNFPSTDSIGSESGNMDPDDTDSENNSSEGTDPEEGTEDPEEDPVVFAPDFTLVDQYGNTHTLSEYRGKTVFLNFWATWCSPCRQEMPHIETIYQEYEKEGEDALIVLGVAAPGYGDEKSVEEITEFLADNDYTFPVLMDETAEVFSKYGITAFPTTFMIDRNGEVYGYVQGQLSEEVMHNIIAQTMNGKE